MSVGNNNQLGIPMGRKDKRNAWLAIGIITASILFILLPIGLVAWGDAAEPDLMQIISVQATGNMTESDDLLIVFHYNIEYATPPDELADELFTFRLIDTDGETELGAISPYTVPNSGYGQGCTAFYFDASEAPTWSGAYYIKIAGNPNMFDDPPVLSYQLTSSDYVEGDNRTVSREYVTSFILYVTAILEDEWDLDLLDHTDVGTVLNSTGESYFRGSIPGIQVMAPDLFYIQTAPPDYTQREWDQSLGANYTSRYSGTMVGNWLDSVETKIGADWSLATTGITILLMVILVAISQMSFARSEPGLLGSAVVFLCSSVMGFVHIAVVALAAFGFAIFTAYVLFWRNA